jgi:hypothetical protein
MNCLHSLGRYDPGLESHSGHECLVCVCVYSVFILSCVWVEALWRADHSSKKSYRLWRDQQTEKQPETTRAVQPFKKRGLQSWSQWPRSLRHELFSLSQKLGSYVRIPLKAWCLHLFCVCVVLCVGSALATGRSLFQVVLPTVYRIKKLKKLPRSNKEL